MYILMLVHLVVVNHSDLRITTLEGKKYKTRWACENKAKKYRYEYPRRFIAARCLRNKDQR